MAFWTPAEIPTALWLDAADSETITESSANIVSQWNDKSGNGRHFAQNAFFSARPSTGLATLNSLNVLGFAIDYLISVHPAGEWTFLHDGTEYEIFAVVRNGMVASPGSNYALLGNTATSTNGRRGVSYYWQRTVPGYVTLISNGGTNSSTRNVVVHETAAGLFPANQFSLVSIYTDPDNPTAADRSFYRSSGGAVDANNAVTNAPSLADPNFGTLELGALGNSSLSLTGEIAEVLIIVRSEVAAERQRVEGYLAWKWGLQATLPSGHPYEFAAPAPPPPTSVSGTVTLDAAAANRTVFAMSAATPFSAIAHAAASGGAFDIDLGVVSDDVLTVALDDYGTRWAADTVYSAGARVRPTAGNDTGYLYEVTVEGDSGPTEPVWWVSESGNIGTAAATAIPMRLPHAHGPITPIEGEPPP